MNRAFKVLVGITCLLTLGSCVSFYVSTQQGTEEYTLWSDVPLEMTFWDWLGIILLILSGAVAFAAYRLWSQENDDNPDSKVY